MSKPFTSKDILQTVIDNIKTNPKTSPLLRKRREIPQTFQRFPESATCPICGTNDDGEAVRVRIGQPNKDGLVAAKLAHLKCALITEWDEGMGVGWTHAKL